MSTKYSNRKEVPTDIICSRLNELSDAVAKGNQGEFTMRVPAELDRDADIVLCEASIRLSQSNKERDRYREILRRIQLNPNDSELIMEWCEEALKEGEEDERQ